MKLWGKTMAELDADHRRMLADRMQRQQNATPLQLGQHYGDALQPVRREYYFGTDIPIEDAEMDEWEEIVAERTRPGMNIPAERWPLITVLAIGAWVLLVGFAWLVLA
jgi:hypothetical protein